MLQSEYDVCPCKKKKCPRLGDCPACMAYHATKKRPPYCERKKDKNNEK